MSKHTEEVQRVARARARRMRALRGKGWTLQAIADEYGVTKQRVHQILNNGSVTP